MGASRRTGGSRSVERRAGCAVTLRHALVALMVIGFLCETASSTQAQGAEAEAMETESEGMARGGVVAFGLSSDEVAPPEAPPPEAPPPEAPEAVTAIPMEPEEGSRHAHSKPSSDHAAVIRHFGVGYLGRVQIPGASNVSVVGARYWLSERWGIQAGLGFNAGRNRRDSEENPDFIRDFFAGALHVGAPFVLHHNKHYKFLFVPEVHFAVGTVDDERDPAIDTDDREIDTFVFGFNLKAGAEIHFGFMGLPKLALQGTVGISSQFSTQRRRNADPADPSQSLSTRTRDFAFSTVNFNDPWDFFAANIAALYYF